MLRYNEGKPRYSLMPYSFHEAVIQTVGTLHPKLMSEMTQVLEKGSTKYADHNWRKSGKWSEVADSALRHLFSRQDNDVETGLPHMAHFGCNLMFLLEFTLDPKAGKDDRYKGPVRPIPFVLETKEALILRFTRWLDGGDRDLLLDALYFLNEYYHEHD